MHISIIAQLWRQKVNRGSNTLQYDIFCSPPVTAVGPWPIFPQAVTTTNSQPNYFHTPCLLHMEFQPALLGGNSSQFKDRGLKKRRRCTCAKQMTLSSCMCEPMETALSFWRWWKHGQRRRDSTYFTLVWSYVSVGRQPGPSTSARTLTWAKVKVRPRHLPNKTCTKTGRYVRRRSKIVQTRKTGAAGSRQAAA